MVHSAADEAHPLVLIEVLASGLPLVATAAGGSRGSGWVCSAPTRSATGLPGGVCASSSSDSDDDDDAIIPALVHQLASFRTALVREHAARLAAEGRLLELERADFGVLFRQMDAFIVHGGLGTTVEAMRMRKPVAVTGVLIALLELLGAACRWRRGESVLRATQVSELPEGSAEEEERSVEARR